MSPHRIQESDTAVNGRSPRASKRVLFVQDISVTTSSDESSPKWMINDHSNSWLHNFSYLDWITYRFSEKDSVGWLSAPQWSWELHWSRFWALNTFLEAMQYACDISETDFCLEVKQTTTVSAKDNNSVHHPPFQGNVPTQKRRHFSNLLSGLRMSPKTTKKQSAISSNQLTIQHCGCVCPLISTRQLAKDAKPCEKFGQLSNQFWSTGESTIATNNYLPENK